MSKNKTATLETVAQESRDAVSGNEEQLCTRCLLDTTVPEIDFDQNGVCQYCRIYDELDALYPNQDGEQGLNMVVDMIKKAGKGKRYDCIVGVSGGTDSTYTLYRAVQLGLRPLAVHFDNGWNARVAVKNIKSACEKLKVELYTYVVDWEEFKDLQVSFLKASTSDAEIPTDVGIISTLIRVAAREGVKYFLHGHSFRTEGVAPIGWTYYDGRYINAVQKRFGKHRLKTFPNFTFLDIVHYFMIRRIKLIPFLNYMDYDKKTAKALIADKLDWEDSGGHHHESVYTEFFQSFLLPQKFNIDKRKTEYSAMVLSGHCTRAEALKDLRNNQYPYKEETVEYTINKLGVTREEFDKIMTEPVKTFRDYPSYFPFIRMLKSGITIGYKLNMIPKVLYLKYRNLW